jgi:hypothetical protein
MPTVKPRVTLTLEENTFEVISRMAQLQKCSRGSVITELLDSVIPVLSRTVALLEAASVAPAHVKDGLRDVISSTHDDLIEVSGDTIKQMDWLFSKMSDSGANPHVVTRGSGFVETRGSASGENPSSPLKSRASAKSGKGVGNAGKKR